MGELRYMEFLPSRSTRYLTSERSELVRYRVELDIFNLS